MKRVSLLMVAMLLLIGCSKKTASVDRVLNFRSKLLQKDGCEFTAEIIADYTTRQYIFKMHCICDKNGNVNFSVLSPESISGITGKLSIEGGALTFDEHALLFPMLAGDRLSPVSAPWVLIRTLRSGYIGGCSENQNGLSIHMDDSYNDDALQVIVQTNTEVIPISAEIFYRNNRILTVIVEDFSFL